MLIETILELDTICRNYTIKNIPRFWFETWNKSMSSYKENRNWFLQLDYFKSANQILKLADDAVHALEDSTSIISSDDGLSMLAWHCYCLLFNEQDTPGSFNFNFPEFDEQIGDTGDLFAAVVLIFGLNNTIKLHEIRGIPTTITVDTLSDLKLWMEHYKDKYGKWGLKESNWLINHFRGRLYRLGRLQFLPGSFNDNIKVFCNIYNGKVIALSEEGIRYRADGQVDGTNDIYDADNYWISEIIINEKNIEGNFIYPNGIAVRDKTIFPVNEWELVLSKGDSVLEIHIPAGSKLDHKLCGESISSSKDFFLKHFPKKEYSAYTCNTWLFDSNFQKILPSSSNIVEFQCEFYLYPIFGNDNAVFQRIFGDKPSDLSKASRSTTLQNAVIEYYLTGNHLHDAGGFIMKADLNWGKDKLLYRRYI